MGAFVLHGIEFLGFLTIFLEVDKIGGKGELLVNDIKEYELIWR